MATEMQKKALEHLVASGRTKKRVIKSQVLREVGYSEDVAMQPQKVFESKGFLELADELGLTDTFLTQALVADIKKKPGKREKELRLAYQVRGRLKDDKGGGGNTFNFNYFDANKLRNIARAYQSGDTDESGETPVIPSSNE